MRAVDTNLLVRVLTRDHAAQARAADAFVTRGAWVSQLVLAETIWVLGEIYERSPRQLAAAVEFLLSHEHFVMQDSETVAAALETYRNKPSLGFSDCLIVEIARKAGHVPVGTFDRQLARLPQVECVL